MGIATIRGARAARAVRILRRGLLSTVAIGLAFLVSGFASATLASHWAANGWYDRHYNYPPVPSGLAQINNVFGQPCSSDANFNRFTWGAEGVTYNVNFHKKLGGAPTPGWYGGNGGLSTNLFYDVRGHIANNHWDSRILGGIWGFNCRLKTGSTTEWSTHAWGVAIDINAAHEHFGHCHNHTVDGGVASIFQNHGWYWGLAFCDAMHFQYATNY
jgi:hypothetical protein